MKSGHSCKTAKCGIRRCYSQVTAAGTSRTQRFTDKNLCDLAAIYVAALVPKHVPRLHLRLKSASTISPQPKQQATRESALHPSNNISTMSQYFDNGRSACTSCISQHQPALLLLLVILIQLACLIWGMWYVDAHFMPKGKD